MNPLRIATHGLLGLALGLGAFSAPVQAGARALQASAMPMFRNVAQAIVGPDMIPARGIVAPDMVKTRGIVAPDMVKTREIVAPDMVQAGRKARTERTRSRTRPGSANPHGVVAPMFHLRGIVAPDMVKTRGIVAPDMVKTRGIVAPDMVRTRGIVAPDMIRAGQIVGPAMAGIVGPAMAPIAFPTRGGLPQGFERPARRGDLSPYPATE